MYRRVSLVANPTPKVAVAHMPLTFKAPEPNQGANLGVRADAEGAGGKVANQGYV